MTSFLNKHNILFHLGRLLIVFVFLYFGFESILHPEFYSGLVPGFITNSISGDTVVMLHGGIEIACGLMILFGLGGIAAYVVLMLSFIGVLSAVSGTILVRDIGILGSLMLLAHIYLKRHSS